MKSSCSSTLERFNILETMLLRRKLHFSLLLSAVSGDAAQDRMDRTVLSPWLRFLWDSYRNCLDLLRNTAVVSFTTSPLIFFWVKTC